MFEAASEAAGQLEGDRVLPTPPTPISVSSRQPGWRISSVSSPAPAPDPGTGAGLGQDEWGAVGVVRTPVVADGLDGGERFGERLQAEFRLEAVSEGLEGAEASSRFPLAWAARRLAVEHLLVERVALPHPPQQRGGLSVPFPSGQIGGEGDARLLPQAPEFVPGLLEPGVEADGVGHGQARQRSPV